MLGVFKHSLKFKREENGIFLKVHHTSNISNEKTVEQEERKVPFILLDMTRSNEKFATVDEEDNIFIFHLTEKCFWHLSDVKINECTAMKFVPHQNNSNLIIGNKSGFIYEIEINRGTILRCTKAFCSAINQLLFPSHACDPDIFVASSSNQIKIYDMTGFVKKNEFSPRNEASRIISMYIVPQDDRLFVVLQSNIICILSKSLKLVRHFEPLKARRNYMQKFNQKMERLNYAYVPEATAVDNEADVDKLIKSVTRDHQNGIIVDISFTQNRNHYCVSFCDNVMLLGSTSLWDVSRVIKFPDFFIKQLAFVPSSMFNSSLLLTTTSNDQLLLINMNDLNSRILIDQSLSFVLSQNGKILLDVKKSGEIFVHDFDHYSTTADVNSDIHSQNCKRTMRTVESDARWNDSKQMCKGLNAELDKIQMKMKTTMPIGRMLPILNEFGEYPEKFRSMIWKTLLKLPQNYNSFGHLLKRGLHSSVANYDKRFPLVDHKALSSLKKIVSCLAHWSSIFGFVNFLPNLVFPFLRVGKGDLIFCFELIATLLNNHCQLWFEFAPLQMPYNYLCIIESILKKNDPVLFEFYKSKNVTGRIYAVPLIETAFSEIFDEQQWLQLWDHIISNDSYFMIFIIVAYNITMRLTIMRYEKVESIERIFVEQNYVNFKRFITKAYNMMEKCAPDIHPKLCMKPFVPLAHGEYQKFEYFPKNVNETKVKEIDALREEQKILDAKLTEMENVEQAINLRLENYLMDEEHESRMRKVESTYEKALEQEEERVTYQRKMLLLSIKNIRKRENEMLIQVKRSLQKNNLESSENELKSMLRIIAKQRRREEIELQMAEENLKLQEMTLQLKNIEVKNSKKPEILKERFKGSIDELANQNRKFMAQLQQLEKLPTTNCSSNVSDVGTAEDVENNSESNLDVDTFERTFQRIQNNFFHSLGSERKDKDYTYKERMKLLKHESDSLEAEVYKFINELKSN